MEGKKEVRGVELFYVIRGVGKDVLLCMPGALGTAKSDFGPQLDSLSASFTVVGFDPRGHGNSRPPSRVYSSNFYHEDAEDAAALMEALHYSSYSVLGWSDGANAGIILASKYPHRVKNLVIWGGNAYITAEDISRTEKTRSIKDWSERMRNNLEAVYGEDLQAMWTSFCDSVKEIYNQNTDICTSECKSLQSPTLLLHGELDPMIASEHVQYFKDNIPTLKKYYFFPQGKHNIHLRYADEFNQLVKDFLLTSKSSL